MPRKLNHPKEVWLNGKFVPWRKATTHVMSQGIHYGHGVFEGIRSYMTSRGRAIIRLESHLDRFYKSAGTAQFKIPYAKEELRKAIIDAIKREGQDESYIRPVAWIRAKEKPIGLHYNRHELEVHVAIAAFRTLGVPKDSVRTCVPPMERISHGNIHLIEAKLNGNYMNSELSIGIAQSYGYEDAILFDHKGYLAEASAANLFLIKDGILYTPPRGSIFPGITRYMIMEIARKNSIKIMDTIPIPRQNRGVQDPISLFSANAMFMCGTALEVTPVHIVSTNTGKKIFDLDNTLIKFFRKIYSDIVHGRDEEYADRWLEFID